MESQVKLAIRIGIVAAVIGLAFLSARGVGNIVSKKIASITPYEVSVADEPKKAELQNNEDDLEFVVYNRDLFNNKANIEEEETTEEPQVIEAIPEEVQEIAVDGKRPVLTDLRVLLKGTQVASDPRYSIAMLMPLEGSDPRMQYLQEGDDLLNEAKIVNIVRNRVYMIRHTQGDRLEYIDTRTTEEDLNEAKKVIEKIKASEAAKPVEQKAAAAVAEVSADVIKKVSPDTYEVPRATVEEIRNNPNILKNKSKYGAVPKIKPVYKGKGINGFRLTEVDSNSIFAQLGLRTGDQIIDINGQQIDNPQKAMSFFDALAPDQDVSVKINRGGSEKTLTFQLK